MSPISPGAKAGPAGSAGPAVDLNQMHDVAVQLASDAGRYANIKFRTDVGTVAKGAGHDVVTDVDHACEAQIISGLLAAFPDHGVLGEESGDHGNDQAQVTWLVDPLDGTNNYVLGLPLFGVCLTASIGGEPVVAVVHDSVQDITTSAIRGAGAFRRSGSESVPLVAAEPQPLRTTTVSWSQGYAVSHDDEFRIAAMDALESNVKRVLRTWSPSIDWGLLARGETGAIVLYRNEPWDMVGGLLIAEESGGVVHRQEHRDCVIAGNAPTVQALVPLLELTH